MPLQITSGAGMACSFGAAPGAISVLPLSVLPLSGVTAAGAPAATIMDIAPLVNIRSFGMCNSPSNE